MSRIFKIFIVCLLLIPSVFAVEYFCQVKAGADKLFEVKAGKTVMKISANGGRIISFTYNQKEIVTQSSEHENFGSTLWTAPQSEWGWPPFEVLDNQKYKVEKVGDILKMTSDPDSKSGFQLEKTWQAAENNSIRIKYLIKNISGKAKSVGPWEVTRVPCGGLAFFPDGGMGKVPDSNLKPDLLKDGIKYISINKDPIPDHQKLFSTANEGWVAYAFEGYLFIKQFPDVQPENYAPQQGEVEVYINKAKSYTELENQGAYRLLQPGETIEYIVNWYLVPIPEKV
ncbi:MAG: DUF4380 domain-containing protein, partial [Chitinophagaceae bacterium]|nr:DUF4380 domain-containing protein [Chitinophagaceae bacterium]